MAIPRTVGAPKQAFDAFMRRIVTAPRPPFQGGSPRGSRCPNPTAPRVLASPRCCGGGQGRSRTVRVRTVTRRMKEANAG